MPSRVSRSAWRVRVSVLRAAESRGGATPPALRLIEKRGANVLDLLRRHQRCEWDAMCAEDRDANWQAALSGESRIFSSFDIGNEGDPAVVWVITEWDRSVTTVLLPSCY